MDKKTALLLIDIQMDYFEGGAFPMDSVQREAAVACAAKVLASARATEHLVVHVRHEGERSPFLRKGTPGTAIHPDVAPLDGELVVSKRHPNSFRQTALQEILQEHGIERLVVGGMIAWMCVQSTVRAAADLGYEVLLVPGMVASKGFTCMGIGLDAKATMAAAMFPLFLRFAKETTEQEAIAALGSKEPWTDSDASAPGGRASPYGVSMVQTFADNDSP